MSINKKLRKNNGDFAIKVILGTSLGLILIMASMLLYNNNKIKQLEDDLYLKQQVEERENDYSISLLNKKTIQENFNKTKSYSILKNSKISQTTTYQYEEEAWLGLKKRATLKGTANLVFDYDVSLSDATIEILNNGKTLKVIISEPFLDEESVHMDKDSLIIHEDKYNILCGEYEGQQTMKYFNDTFVANGIDNIKELYNTADKRKEINKIAIGEIRALIETFNINDCTIIVEMK